MRKISIDILAMQYAAKISLQVPGYTKEKAKQIFKSKYYLVELFLKRLELTNDKELNKRLRTITVFNVNKINYIARIIYVHTELLNQAKNYSDNFTKSLKKLEHEFKEGMYTPQDYINRTFTLMIDNVEFELRHAAGTLTLIKNYMLNPTYYTDSSKRQQHIIKTEEYKQQIEKYIGDFINLKKYGSEVSDRVESDLFKSVAMLSLDLGDYLRNLADNEIKPLLEESKNE